MMRRIYLGTMIMEFVTLAGQLVAYRLAASYLGSVGFSEYALVKRTIALILPAVMLGLGVAIPRYVAVCTGESVQRDRRGYLAAGMLLFGASITVSLVLLNLFKSAVAYLFFGSGNYGYLVAPLSFMIFGLGLHTACYGYFRGRLEMAKANALNLVNQGIVPLVVFPLYATSTYRLLNGLGAFWTVVSLVALLTAGLGGPRSETLARTSELLRYGVRRVFADFFQLAFLTLPATFTAHLYGIQEAGFVAFGTSLLTMVASLFFPVGAVLLPEASQMVGEGNLQALERRTLQVLSASSLISVAVIGGIFLFGRPMILLYLGSGFVDVVNVVRVMALGVLPYSIYVCLKNVIDALTVKAINSRNMMIAFGLFLCISSSVYLGVRGLLYIPIFVVISLYLLGALTILTIWQILTSPEARAIRLARR